MLSRTLLFLLPLSIGVISVGCSGDKQAVVEAVRPVKCATVESTQEFSQEYVGVVETNEFVNLSFRVPGQIVKLNVVYGQRLAKGDLVAQLDPRDFNLQVDVTLSAFNTAKSQLERSERLYAKQTISKQDYEIAQNNFNVAKVNYENAQNSLKDTRLYAPFTGVVEKLPVNNFQKVQVGETIIKLTNPSDLYVLFTVADRRLITQRKNFDVYVQFIGFADMYRASIKEIMEISQDGAGIPVSLNIIDPEFLKIRSFIKPGFSCTVQLRVPGKEIDAVVVPLTALFKDIASQEVSVWVVDDKTSVVTRRAVTKGPMVGQNQVFVTDGITSGQQVVIAGVQMLKEGQRVLVLK